MRYVYEKPNRIRYTMISENEHYWGSAYYDPVPFEVAGPKLSTLSIQHLRIYGVLPSPEATNDVLKQYWDKIPLQPCNFRASQSPGDAEPWPSSDSPKQEVLGQFYLQGTLDAPAIYNLFQTCPELLPYFKP